MTKADELWEKYAIDELIDREQFLAALKEYGEAVRKRNAEIANDMILYAGCDIAAAIEREPLP